MMWKITGIYLLIVNLTAFFLYGIDKKRAIKQKWRISEKTLIRAAYSLEQTRIYERPACVKGEN